MSNYPPPPVISSIPNFFPQPLLSPPPSPPSPPPSQSSSSPLQNLNPAVILTLLILSIIIITTTFVCLVFHRSRLLTYLPDRHLSVTSSVFTGGFATVAASPNHQNPANTNLSSSVVDALPLFTYSSIAHRPSASASGDCAVCLSKFQPLDQIRLLPLCCHAFHADCVDAWLHTNQTCPLCRSNIHASDSDIAALLRSNGAAGSSSFRIEIGSVSRRLPEPDAGDARSSYSVGSFEYIVDGESEVAVQSHRRSVSDKEDGGSQQVVDPVLAAEVAAGRSWLGDYMDQLSATVSSRALSFRSSRRFFAGSSRRSEVAVSDDWEIDSSRVGEEISEMFRWASGV